MFISKKKLKLKLKLKKRIGLKPSELTIPSDFSLIDPGVTQGLVMTFLTCRRKFLYAINRIRPAKKSMNFFFGSFGHDMLESWYKTGKYNIAGFKYKELAIDKQVMEFSKAKMKAILDNYTQVYKKDSFTSIETQFDFIDNCKIYKRRGKMDAVTKNGFLVDHKFKGRITEDEISAKLTFDFQMLFYITTFEMSTGKRLSGVLYNIIRNPGHKQSKKESLSQFTKRLSNEIKKDPEHFFMRFEVTFTAKDKADFNRELLHKIQDMKDVIDGKLYPYKNEASCTGMFGCEYLKACSSDTLNGFKKYGILYPELEE